MIILKVGEFRKRALAAMEQSRARKDPTTLDTLIQEAEQSSLLDIAALLRAQKASLKAQFAEAIAFMDEALRLNGRLEAAHLLKIVTLLENKDNERAIQAAERAIESLPFAQLAPFYINKAVALFRMHRLEEAKFLCLMSMEAQGTYELSYRNLLLACIELGEWDNVLAIVARVREVFSTDAEVVNRYTNVIAQQAEKALKAGQPELDIRLSEEGRLLAELALKIDPEKPGHYYNLACAYSRLGRRDEAIENLRKAIELEGKKGETRLRQLARGDADFERIRNEPSFKALVDA
jgi:tetratricopeptide (TPR) repeat protein